MTERTRNLAVGLTGLGGLVVLAVLLALFGYAPRWLDAGYEVHVRMDHAMGLRRGSRVTFNGIDVGEVVAVELTPPPDYGVNIVTHIQAAVRLPEDVEARVTDRLLGGSPMLSLSWRREPPDVAIEYLPTNGTAVIQGETSSLAQDLIGQLGTQLEEPIAQLKRLTDSFDVLSAQWTDVGRNVNLLVEPRTPDAVDGDEQVGNLASMVARADERMAEMRDVMANMNRTLEGLQSWIEDDEFRADAAATVSNARALTENLNEQVTVLSRRYVAVADDLARAINTMEQTLELARTGEGTVGKLLNDPALYDNLNDASQRLNLAMDELNLLLEKFRTEGLPLQFE